MCPVTIFDVRGDTIKPRKYGTFNSGSKGYYTAVFNFDSAWEGLIPHITISKNGKKRADEIIVDNTFKIAVAKSGTMRVGVYGLDPEGNKCISSNEVLFEVKKGAYDGTPAIPSDIWDGYQITVLGYVKRAEAAVKAVKNFTVSAVSGTEAEVEKTETDTGIHYEFTLPRGEKGDTPVKGVDYFTEDDKDEMLSEPRGIIHLTNGVRIEAREDGIWLVDKSNTDQEQKLYDKECFEIFANFADTTNEASFAYSAECDSNGFYLKGCNVEEYGDEESINHTIYDGGSVSYGIISNSLNAVIEEDYQYTGFTSALFFATPSEIPENYTQFPADIYFKGDSTDEGAFVPEANMRYTIVFDFDGYMLNAYVSGVTTV